MDKGIVKDILTGSIHPEDIEKKISDFIVALRAVEEEKERTAEILDGDFMMTNNIFNEI
jgi:hypothetical protein